MTTGQKDAQAEPIEQLLDIPDLADALESERFKQFLDHIPIAIAVSELRPTERIVYVNLEFERLAGQPADAVLGRGWDALPGEPAAPGESRLLGQAIVEDQDHVGTFCIGPPGQQANVHAWSNLIEDDEGKPAYRLIALGRGAIDRSALEERLHEADLHLRELQHRVKNNLQMITALIRIEARNVPAGPADDRFDRLAGRMEALALLYRSLASEGGNGDSIDLGIYLSEIASAVMRAHAVEGIRLDLRVDTWPVSINVAMPAGLVVNELLTNALKHAFPGGEGGTVTLHSLVDDEGCRVVIADDGVGLAPDAQWPRPGKLGTMIVNSLRQNARARLQVDSQPGKGTRITVLFARADALPPG